MRSTRLSALCAGIVLAAACASGKGDSPSPDNPAAGSSTPENADAGLEALLVHLNAMHGKTRAELAAELERIESEFDQQGSAQSRLELAWLLSRPNTGFQDERRAVVLLREYYDGEGASGGFAAFARLLHDLLLARAVQQAASSRAKAELAAEREQAAALREQIATLQQVLETLQLQFEALKDIETSLSARPSPETELLSNDGDTQDPVSR